VLLYKQLDVFDLLTITNLREQASSSDYDVAASLTAWAWTAVAEKSYDTAMDRRSSAALAQGSSVPKIVSLRRQLHYYHISLRATINPSSVSTFRIFCSP
jgi:hypothetical protein